MFRKKLARGQVLSFLASQPPCPVALEACGGSHYWARAIAELGYQVKLIAPKYVKPFVKRQKNDMDLSRFNGKGVVQWPACLSNMAGLTKSSAEWRRTGL